MNPGSHWNRRDFLRFTGLALGAAGTLGFAACGGEDRRAAAGEPDPRATPQRDRAILNGALTLENTAVAAYAMGLPLLRGEARRTAERFLAQEREHAAALTRLVRDLGGEPNRPKPPAEYRAAFPRLPDQAAFLRFASDLENVAISAYAEGIPKLKDSRLRELTATIFSDEAQHVTVLLGARHDGNVRLAVPEPFVTGRVRA
jgi:rubrerythrin